MDTFVVDRLYVEAEGIEKLMHTLKYGLKCITVGSPHSCTHHTLVLSHEQQFGQMDLWSDAAWLVLQLQLPNPLVPLLRRSWAVLEQGKSVLKVLIVSSDQTPPPQARSSLLH